MCSIRILKYDVATHKGNGKGNQNRILINSGNIVSEPYDSENNFINKPFQANLGTQIKGSPSLKTQELEPSLEQYYQRVIISQNDIEEISQQISKVIFPCKEF